MRYILWSLLAAYLLVVGLWPSAAAPVSLTLDGLNAVLATIPGPVLLLAAVIGWLKHRPTAKPAVA